MVSQTVSPFWIFLGGQVVSEKLHLVRHKGPIANLQASPGEGTWVTNVMAMSYWLVVEPYHWLVIYC